DGARTETTHQDVTRLTNHLRAGPRAAMMSSDPGITELRTPGRVTLSEAAVALVAGLRTVDLTWDGPAMKAAWGAGMSNPLDLQRILRDCMQNIEGASTAMVDDMNDAAMKLGAASMMLASASHAVHMHAAQLPQVPPAPHNGRPG